MVKRGEFRITRSITLEEASICKCSRSLFSAVWRRYLRILCTHSPRSASPEPRALARMPPGIMKAVRSWDHSSTRSEETSSLFTSVTCLIALGAITGRPPCPSGKGGQLQRDQVERTMQRLIPMHGERSPLRSAWCGRIRARIATFRMTSVFRVAKDAVQPPRIATATL